MRQQSLLLRTANRVDQLRDALHGGVFGRNLDALRVLQQTRRQLADVCAEGGRKQQALLFLGQQRQHFLHVVDKTHIQHAVGFVQHQGLHLAQVQYALASQIQQAPGGGHQNVHAAAQAADLRAHANAAKNDSAGQLQVLAIGFDRLFHLRSKLARGGQHQGADAGAAKAVLGAARHGQAVQDGQHKGGGFAGAGLGTAQNVLPGQNDGDGLGLDGGGSFVAMGTHGADNGRGQLKVFKVHW